VTSTNSHEPASPEVIRAVAVANGVCVRPIMQRLVDTLTGREQLVPIDCGSTQDRRCPTCAERNRRLRMQQCREGWHTTEETLPPLPEPDDNQDESDEDQDDEPDDDDTARRVVHAAASGRAGPAPAAGRAPFHRARVHR
jgi:hypothetical protein